MNKLLTFLRLNLRDKYLLIRIAFLMLAIRLGLSVVPFKVLLSFLRSWREGRASGHVLDPKRVKRAMWGIRVISPYIPGVTCLTQALAALMLLGTFDQTVSVRIGIAKEEGGDLIAHAWVETEGKIVMGNMLNLSRYSILSGVDSQPIHERDIRNS